MAEPGDPTEDGPDGSRADRVGQGSPSSGGHAGAIWDEDTADLFEDRPAPFPVHAQPKPDAVPTPRPFPSQGYETARPDDADPDDLIGFSSARSLVGHIRGREAEPARSRFSRPVDARTAAAPEPVTADPASDSSPTPTASPSATPSPAPPPASSPVWATQAAPSEPRAVFGRGARGQAPTAEGAMGLYAVYALILFAVPTVGVSALLGLLAIIVRPTPTQPLALSHHLFQKRTLWTAAIAAVVGGVLIAAPLGIGVLVLFLLAVWVMVRGAWGVMTLMTGRTLSHPLTWLISETK